MFGLPVQDRKLHSARSASEEYGITSQTLKKRLRALGVEGRTVAGPNNSIFIFEASSFEDQLREIEEGMTKRVRSNILVLSLQLVKRVFSAGLVPHVHLPGAKGSRAKGYVKSDLDAFVASLRTHAEKWNGDDSMHPIPRAVGRARTPLNRIVKMILSKGIPMLRTTKPNRECFPFR